MVKVPTFCALILINILILLDPFSPPPKKQITTAEFQTCHLKRIIQQREECVERKHAAPHFRLNRYWLCRVSYGWYYNRNPITHELDSFYGLLFVFFIQPMRFIRFSELKRKVIIFYFSFWIRFKWMFDNGIIWF